MNQPSPRSRPSRRRAIPPAGRRFPAVLPAFLLALLVAPPCIAAVVCVDDDNATGVADGSALHPYPTLQAAVDAASAGDEIRAAAGAYARVEVRSKALRLRGGYAGGSASDYASGAGGDFATRDPLTRVSHVQGDGAHATVSLQVTDNDPSSLAGTVVDGFRITGGTHGISCGPDGWPDPVGVTLSGNRVENNGTADGSAGNRGGGIWATGHQIHIVNNVIRDNVAGRAGGLFAAASLEGGTGTMLIEENLIRDNRGYGDHGGGVCLAAGVVTFRNNVVDGNRVMESYGWGGGLLTYAEEAHLSGNVFRNNFAPSYGGAVFVDEGGKAWLDHELYYGNTTSSSDKGGAALAVDSGPGPSHAWLDHCTFALNTAPGALGGNAVFVDNDSHVTVKNCIFWGNSTGDVYVREGSTLQAAYTLSLGGLPGAGNITADPLFADPAAGDFHLKSAGGRWDPSAGGGAGGWVADALTSPALDAADPASPWAEEPSPNGGRANLGCYGNTAQASRTPGGASPFDLNRDGLVNAADLALLGAWFAGSLPQLPCGIACADVDGSGSADAADLVALARAVVKTGA
ncbi:MAG: right-handed parallel beta-helix repeat-containing protein [Acidobacteria bacterium]|nr:right-handed parallel beta-helix repeat-containing protein [Acidobacteriota bacterium]